MLNFLHFELNDKLISIFFHVSEWRKTFPSTLGSVAKRSQWPPPSPSVPVEALVSLPAGWKPIWPAVSLSSGRSPRVRLSFLLFFPFFSRVYPWLLKIIFFFVFPFFLNELFSIDFFNCKFISQAFFEYVYVF